MFNKSAEAMTFPRRLFVGFIFLVAICFLGQTRVQAGWLYVLNDDPAGSRIYGFQVNESTGALTALSGFPVATGFNGGNALVCERMAIDTVNNRLFVINDGSNNVSAYSIDPATGALASLPFSPIPLDNATWNSIAVHPSGSPLVVGDGSTTTGRIASFQITSTTAMAAAGSPYAINPASAFSSVFSQDGNYVYIGGNMGALFAGLSVNASTGVLTPLAGSPFSSATGNPVAHATDAAGRFYVVTTTPEIRVFTTASGIPTAVTGNPFSVFGMTQRRDGLIHGNGNFYIVAGNSGNNVGVFQVSGSGSATSLAAVAGSPFATGGTTANALALNQAGTILYVANRLSRNVTTFAFDTSTGVLTSQGVQPSNTLGATGFLCGIAYLPQAAANAEIGGRVTDASGNGIANVRIQLVSMDGTVRLGAITNPFGYYNFPSVPTGTSYAITPSSKTHTFAPPSINHGHSGNVSNINFTGTRN